MRRWFDERQRYSRLDVSSRRTSGQASAVSRRSLGIEQLEDRRLLAVAPFPVPLEPIDPTGSLIYTSNELGQIDAAQEVDRFTIDLDDTQTVTLLITPDAALRPTIELSGPFGGSLGSATAGLAGEAALLQVIPTNGSGTYTIDVTGAADTTGAYSCKLILGAAVEEELVAGGPSNDIGSAQDFDASSQIVPDMAAGRGAVLGHAEDGDPDYYRLSLSADQALNVSLTSNDPGRLGLDLYDSAGTLLAEGIDSSDRSDGLLDGIIIADELLVSVDARTLDTGPVGSWANDGSLGGEFVASGDPVVETVDGQKAVTLDGSGDWFVGPNSPAGIEDENDRSIEAWVFNPSIGALETVVSWSKRGTTAGDNCYSYGSNNTWGAATHSGTDMGWGRVPAAGTWHHLVWTYDGTDMRVYSDGVQTNSKDFNNTLDSFNGLPINIGAARWSGEGMGAYLGSLSIASLRIHDGVLSADDVLHNFREGITPEPTVLPSDEIVVADDLLVSVDAQALAEGRILSWNNDGSLGGSFAASGDPTVETVDGHQAVTLDGYGDWFVGPAASTGIEDESDRSIEAWVYNPNVAFAETVVSWSKGGTRARDNAYLYSSGSGWGAATHWNNDMPWGTVPAAGTWHHLAWTYDGTDMRVYSDGVEQNSKDFGDTLDSFNGKTINIGARRRADETVGDRPGSLSIAALRIHDGLLSADDVLHNFNAGITAGPPTAEQVIDDFTVPQTGDYFVRVTGVDADYSLVATTDAAFAPQADAGLVGYWPLDENGGTVANDLAESNDGTIHGAQWIDGVVGSALLLDGTDDYVALGNPSELQLSGQITISAWVQPQATGGIRNIVAHGYTWDPDREVTLRIQNGNYRIASWTGTDHWATYPIPLGDIGSWVHLTGTYDGATWNLYRNGELVSTAADYTGAVEVPADWAIGAKGSGDERFFQGGLDEVRIYDRALSGEEVRSLFEYPAGVVDRRDITATGTALGALSYLSGAQDFTFSVNAGDSLLIRTRTPADGTGQFVNLLDPTIELYDPFGVSIAFDDNGEADLRNAMLSHTAEVSGMYRVRVSAADNTAGEYVLSVEGNTGDLPPFEVVATDPPGGALLQTMPDQMTIQFTDPLLLSSLDAADLTVGGQPADGFTVVDGRTVTFELPPLGEGVYAVSIAAGSILDLQGTPVDAYDGQLTVDGTSPRIIDISLREGDVVAPGTLQIVVQFDEELDATVLDTSDVSLQGAFSGWHTPSSFVYDSAASTLTLRYADLPDDMFTLRLRSGSGRFQDLVGNFLDGEADPISTVPSGNGKAGGHFYVHFVVDGDTLPFTDPLKPRDPAGSWVFDTAGGGATAPVADTDSFTIDLEAGTVLTVVVDPDSALQPNIELLAPDMAPVGTATASSPGQDAVLQTVAAAASGTYTINITGQGGTTGSYSAYLALNAAVEEESHGGAANNDIGSAELLSDVWGLLPGGVGTRGAVLGYAATDDPDFYRVNLEAGELLSLSVETETAGPLSLELTDSTGDPLAAGVVPISQSPLTSTNQMIENFRASVAGDYYVRIAGADVQYNLVFARDAALDTEPGYTRIEDTQAMASTGVAVGAVQGDYTVSPDVVDHVIHISFDGFRADFVQALVDAEPVLHSNLKRLQDEGAFTYNARSDYSHTVTLPNHTSQVTGRPVTQPAGQPNTVAHNWTSNSDPRPGVTIHNNNPYVEYISSVFNVAHDYGLSTAHFAGKSKFSLFEDGWGPVYGAVDTNPLGGDNGRNKIDVSLIDSNTPYLVDTFLAEMSVTPRNYGFLHLRDLDSIGHSTGWGSEAWIAAVAVLDDYLGEILDMIETNPAYAGKTALIVTADHGGINTGHGNASLWEDYTIPEFVWGPGIPAATDLYELDPHHFDPGTGRPDYNAAQQPIRNGGTGNLALELLGLPAIPGSSIGNERADLTDRYSIEVNAGDNLSIKTFTPGGPLGPMLGSLDPAVELIAPDGTTVGFDDNGAGDGRNASLNHVAASSGTYTVRVSAQNYSQGEYVLNVSGNTGTATAFEVVSTDPAGGIVLPSEATQITVEFNHPVRISSLDATDLRVGPITANGWHLLDGNTVVFELPALPAGTYDVTIPADRIFDLQGTPNQPYDIGQLTIEDGVIGRHIFYNNSAWDDETRGRSDDAAIAPDKTALLPEEHASFANYTNYAAGINGIKIDLFGSPDPQAITAADFGFKAGNTGDPNTWSAVPPWEVTVSEGAGIHGSDRVTIIWPDNTITNQWLQVTVKDTPNTGLTTADVFYFGNAVGDAGDSTTNTIVNATDEIVARNFQHSAVAPALVDDPYDYNRDRLVNGTDQIIARNNQTDPLTMLRLITAPAADAAFQQTITENQDSTESLSAAFDWKYEYEAARAKDAKSKDVETTVDMLLATGWE